MVMSGMNLNITMQKLGFSIIFYHYLIKTLRLKFSQRVELNLMLNLMLISWMTIIMVIIIIIITLFEYEIQS
jgi:hypothetical protein